MDINSQLKREADMILEMLMPALSTYGSIHVLGSYNLNTMVWKDLDISLLTQDLLSETIFGIVETVGTIVSPTEIMLKNYSYVSSRHGNNGRYIQCKQAHIGSIEWDKIDIIVSDDPEHIQQQIDKNMYWKGVIKESDKEAIMEIKERLCTHPMYRKEIVSVDIYKAVSLEGVKGITQFKEWLLETKNVVV